MRTITTNIYRLNELSEMAKAKDIDNNRYDIASIADEGDSYEYENCLTEMEKIFDIDVYRWSVDSCSHSYQFSITSERFSEHEDDPKMLLRYINDIYYYLYKGKYYGKSYRGSNDEWIHKKRYSKVIRELSCPLTGTWTDYAAEKAMENAFEFVRRGMTIREFIGDMLEHFFTCWEEDLYYHLSDEYVEEEICINEYEFLEDGKRYVS